MSGNILGVRLNIERIDAEGETDYVEATLAYVPAEEDVPDSLELTLADTGATLRLPEAVVHEALRLLNALPENTEERDA